MLPDILERDEVNTVGTQEKVRRPETMRVLGTWVYGATPVESPDYSEAKVTEAEHLTEDAIKKGTYYLHMERKGRSCEFHRRAFSPAMGKTAGAVLIISPFFGNQALDYPGKELDHTPYDLITTCGYIGVHVDMDELCVDNTECYKEGLWELFPESMEETATWGAIGMWAYTTSYVVSYLIMQDFVEYGRVVVCDCSRVGKAALWCGTQDERIGLVISNVSGCTGAATTRGKTGEHIKDITTQFPHWICKHYASFADREEELPVDQHMLLAPCMSRPFHASGAPEDSWVDPQKESETAKLAGEVYGLYGETGLGGEASPEADIPMGNGFICYHNRQGAHGYRRYGQEQYLSFIQNHFS